MSASAWSVFPFVFELVIVFLVVDALNYTLSLYLTTCLQ
jgi:hypothetical protein